MKNGQMSKILGLGLLASFLLFQPVHGADKGLIIKIATLAPEGSSWVKAFRTCNSEVMKRTENRVQFRIYAGGVLGDEMDMLRKMRINQIQGVALTSGGLSALFKEIDVLQIPFLFQNYEEVDYVLGKMDLFFRKGLEDSGHVLLGWSEAGFIYLMSNTPIVTVSDLKRSKAWIWEDSSMAKLIFDEAGVKAIPLSVPDVLVGLQTGLVDVVYAPPTGAISLQWFTKIKYLTDIPLAYLAGAIIIRKETFKEIPQRDQNVILETSQRYLDQLKKITRNENREAIKVMMKQGIKIITPTRQQIDEYRELSGKAMSRPSGQSFSKKVMEDVMSLLENYRKGGR